jgi:protein-S-isoprenylcysteine O-methyltransferase Ste14
MAAATLVDRILSASARPEDPRASARLAEAPETRRRSESTWRSASKDQPYRPFSPTVSDLLARASIGALFTLLSINLFADYMRTGHVTGLLLLVGESLVVVLTIVRRRAIVVDRSAVAAVMTTISLAGPALLRATDAPVSLASDQVTAMLSGVGLVLVVMGKMALGRSFGVVPANRGVVVRGPYSLVRHPIYTGYLITHASFLVAHPAPWNLSIILFADVALILRALMEERVLSTDAAYQQYCRRVGWHLVPGVF